MFPPGRWTRWRWRWRWSWWSAGGGRGRIPRGGRRTRWRSRRHPGRSARVAGNLLRTRDHRGAQDAPDRQADSSRRIRCRSSPPPIARLVRRFSCRSTPGRTHSARRMARYAHSWHSVRHSKSDLGEARADSLNARLTRLSADVDRAFNAVNAQRAPIEGWSGLPSVDQRKSLEFALDDARTATADLNRLVSTDIPAAYKAAGRTWSGPVPRVQQPASGGGETR